MELPQERTRLTFRWNRREMVPQWVLDGPSSKPITGTVIDEEGEHVLAGEWIFEHSDTDYGYMERGERFTCTATVSQFPLLEY